MTRLEFSMATRKAGWERCKGNCESCGFPILPERPEYHHVIEAALGGDNSLGNMLVLHSRCHRIVTSTHSAPVIAKVNRIRNKARGIKYKRQTFGTSRSSRWKKKLSGETVLREERDMDS